jgi:nucleotidyltransferase/DNA polymerase involved in DNA repair
MNSRRRVAAVVLPSYRIALVRARAAHAASTLANAPLAIVVDAARSERGLTGGTRIDDVSDEARACGVLPGATIASAKATCAELRVRVLHPREAKRAIDGLAEMLLALGAITANVIDRDCVLVDVTGCAHLHQGEAALLDAIVAMVAHAGFSCRVAIASGPEIAWAIARESARSRVVDDEDTMRALGELSIDVLRLDPSTASYFHRLGVRTISAMRALPRAALTARIENQNLLARARAILDGEDHTPIPRFVPAEILEERAELEYGIEHHEALFFVLKTLCDRMSVRLAARSVLASKLEVILELDRAMCAPSAPRKISVVVPLASPIRKSAELALVLRSRFEREPELSAPALVVVLRAPDLAPIAYASRHLFVPESRAELALPKLVAELAALMDDRARELGIGTLAVRDDWRIDHRSVLVPFGTKIDRAAPTCSIEPMRLVAPHATHSARELHHLARFERVVWWRESAPPRDWKLVWDEDAIAFVEVTAGECSLRGYLD